MQSRWSMRTSGVRTERGPCLGEDLAGGGYVCML